MKTTKSVIVLAASAFAWLACGFAVQTACAQVPPGHCLYFGAGNGARVTVPHHSAFNAYPLTLTAWVQVGNQPSIILRRLVPDLGGYWLSVTNGTVYARYVKEFPSTGTSLLRASGASIADGRWHHLAFVVASSPRLYVDGVERSQGIWTGTQGACQVETNLVIGGEAAAPMLGRSLVDEVTLWDRELSQGAIQGVMATPANGATNGLVASWRFQEGSGSTTADSTGHGHDGSLEDGPAWIILGPPAVATTMAYYFGSTNAAVFGWVNPRTLPAKAWFEWGTNLTYGHTSAVMDASSLNPGMSNVVVSTAIGPVSFGTIHYRAAASNSFGRTVGEDRTFDTTRLWVTTLADNESGSLRYVLSNALPETTIGFNANLSGTILLTNGELVIDRNVTLVGPGADRLAVSGSLTSRVFNVRSGVTARISGLTIQEGRTPNGIDYSGSLTDRNSACGGGIYNLGSLTLEGCVVTNNATGRGGVGSTSISGGFSGSGGGICNGGTLVMTRCTVSGNATGAGGPGRAGSSSSVHGGDGGDSGSGGGMYNGGTLELHACTISSNAVGAAGAGGAASLGGYGGNGGDGGNGGGIFHYSGRLALENCTISGNRSGTGGAGGMDGRILPPFTFGESGTVGRGGGLSSPGYSLLVKSCTITSNAPGSGGRNRYGANGGIYASASRPSLLVNTLIAGNAGFSNITDVCGAFVSGGHNLIGSGEGSVGLTNGILQDQVGSPLAPLDPLLGPLTHNGGTNWTHALLPGSPAIDTGLRLGVPLTDQRGLRRVVCCTSDIGAFELQECTNCLSPVISFMTLDSNQTRWLHGNGEPNVSYTLQVSTNLLHWSDLTNVTCDSVGLFGHGDPAVDLAPQRFYRLRKP